MAKKRQKRDEWVDDGRVIASMNVEGMPGYRRQKRRAYDEFGAVKPASEPVELTRSERRAIRKGVITAALTLVGVVVVIAVLVMLFLTKVWLRA